MEVEIVNINEVEYFEDSIFFFNKVFLQMNKNVSLICFYEKSEIVSMIPIEIKKRLIFKIGRLLFEPYPLNNQKVIDELIVFLNREKIVDFLSATPNYIPFKYYPNHSIVCNFGSYQLNLGDTEETLFKKIHSKHRNVIRKCEKENLEIICNKIEVLDDCYELLKETMSRSNMEYPSYSYLKNLALKIPNNVYYGVVYHNKIAQGTIYLYYSNKSAYYIYGGSRIKPFTGAMNYLHWNAIKELKYLDVAKYDFVGARINPEKGSKVEGIQRFKERFGATLFQGFMWKYIFNKPKYMIYILILRILSFKNRTEFKGDIIDQERNK